MGAMIFGGIAEEHLQLNEDSVWAGARRDRINPAAAAAVPEVRRLLTENRIKEAEALADRDMIAVGRRMPPYQPLGDLKIQFTGFDESAVTNYRRELDIETRTRTCHLFSRKSRLCPRGARKHARGSHRGAAFLFEAWQSFLFRRTDAAS